LPLPWIRRLTDRSAARRTVSALDGRSVHVRITAAGRALVERETATFEEEIAVLVSDLSPIDRSRLSSLASLVAITEAKPRGVDVRAV
jgi:DNA-binding MarR family transcriptional regulator